MSHTPSPIACCSRRLDTDRRRRDAAKPRSRRVFSHQGFVNRLSAPPRTTKTLSLWLVSRGPPRNAAGSRSSAPHRPRRGEPAGSASQQPRTLRRSSRSPVEHQCCHPRKKKQPPTTYCTNPPRNSGDSGRRDAREGAAREEQKSTWTVPPLPRHRRLEDERARPDPTEETRRRETHLPDP